MVGLKAKYYWYQIGSGDFLHAFFSTIAFNLENGKWGSRFPLLMRQLYNGTLEVSDIDCAISELNHIKRELSNLSVEKVVWDIEDLSKIPPWGSNISSDITDLSNYFITSDGEDLIAIFSRALEQAKILAYPLKIEYI